jgi:hypothetical protein
MDPTVGFPLFLGATVVLLGAVVWTGLTARVAIHIPLVALTLVSLALAIYFALGLGRLYDLKAAGAITPTHMVIARIATASYLLPIVTGVMTLRSRKHRRLHFWMAMLVIVLTVVTAITGTWMLLLSPRVA